MKQLFKLSLFAAFLAFTSVSFAQIGFGVKAGFNLAKFVSDDDEANPKLVPTFQAGAVLELGLTENIAIHSGISIQGKGSKTEEEILNQPLKATFNAYYIQVPAHLLYKGSGFFVGVGPYVGFAVAGNGKLEYLGEKETEKAKFGNSEDDDFSPLDFGVGAQAGVKVGSVRIGAGYDFGLSNILPKDSSRRDDLKISNAVISVFVQYMLGQ